MPLQICWVPGNVGARHDRVGSNRRIRKTVRPVVWEGAAAQSPAITSRPLCRFVFLRSVAVKPARFARAPAQTRSIWIMMASEGPVRKSLYRLALLAAMLPRMAVAQVALSGRILDENNVAVQGAALTCGPGSRS